MGQYPIKFHGETLREIGDLFTRTKVIKEHKAVERDTERILARMASGASRGRPATALVAGDA